MRSRRRSTTVLALHVPSNTQTPPTCMCTGPRSAWMADRSEGERGSATDRARALSTARLARRCGVRFDGVRNT